MGPLATADLYRKIIESTPATRDQEHLHVIIDADPSVPDRTAALRGEAPDPTPWLVRAARRLAIAGADFVVMPCNTAHAYLPQLRARASIPILDMIEETAARVRTVMPAAERVGLLATCGTVETGLYHQALALHGLLAVTPEADEQVNYVDAAIEAVKGGDVSCEVGQRLATAAEHLVTGGAQVLLAACTEIPLVLTPAMVSVPLLDPTLILAQAAVREATRTPAAAVAG